MFNDLDEETLTRNRTLQKFKVRGRFLKGLQRLFPFEVASLIHDAVCGTDDNFKIPLEKEIKRETHTKETNEKLEAQNYQEQITYDINETNHAINVALQQDETQFHSAELWDKTCFELPTDKSKDLMTLANETQHDTAKTWDETSFKQPLTESENVMTQDNETQFDSTATNSKQPPSKSKDKVTLINETQLYSSGMWDEENFKRPLNKSEYVTTPPNEMQRDFADEENNFKRPLNKSKDVMTLAGETQFDTAEEWDDTNFKPPLTKSKDISILTKSDLRNSAEFTEPIWGFQKLKQEEKTQNTNSTNYQDQIFSLDTFQYDKSLLKKKFEMEQSKIEFSFPKSLKKTENPWEITQTDPTNFSCSDIDETENLDVPSEKNKVLEQDTKISMHLKPKPNLRSILENPGTKCLECQKRIETSTDLTTQKYHFYPEETSDELESQLAKLALEEMETHFFDSLDWNSLSIKTQTLLDGQCKYLEKFFCAVTQFNYLMSSKPLSHTDYSSQKSGHQLQPSYKGIKSGMNDLETAWSTTKRKETENEKTLTKSLQEIFKHLDELINDFSKLHTTIFDYNNFLMRKVFPVIGQYFNERSSCEWMDNEQVCDSLNICCNFIKKTINEIVASDELCGFLKWEEQHHLVSELCNSKTVCQNILDFLLTQTVILLSCVEDRRRRDHQRIYQDSGIIEKLSIIFSLMEVLVAKFIDIRQREQETTDCQDSEEKNIFRLWEQEATVEEKNVTPDILQDSDSNENNNLEDKWMQSLELIVRLTEESLIIFSLTGQKCLQALKEARGCSEIKYTFSQSQTSSIEKR